jgi:single-strand DNA-binding protein
MINRVVLVARLVRDCDLRYSQSGTAICNFTVACDRPFKNAQGEKETDFIRIVCFKKLGENCANYLVKGQMCAVEGRIQVRNYEVDGQKRQAFEVVADNVRFLDKPKNEPDFGVGADDF